MWVGIDPSDLCREHLLGEHKEMHQEVGTYLRHPHGEAVVQGHVDKAQVVPSRIRERHDALAAEMERRGYDHDSPLEDFAVECMPKPSHDAMNGIHEANRDRLARRCDDCAKRMQAEDAIEGMRG